VSPAKEVPWRLVKVAPVILVSGPQDFFAESAIKMVRDQMRKTNVNLEVVEIDASDYAPGQIFDLASAGLFGDSKLVVIDGVERCSDSMITDGIEYAQQPAEDAVVIFRHNGKTVRGKRLLESLRSNELVIEATCLEITKEAERLGFVESEFNSKGRKIQRAAAQALIDIFGKDFEELSAACSQLQIDDSGEITPQIVEKYFGGRLETTGYKIADSALAGRAAESLLLLRHGLDQGAEGVLIIYAFSKKINDLAKMIGNPNVTAANMGMPDWVFRKTRESLAGWSEEAMARVIHTLADTDFAIKGGEKDSAYALERLVSLVANKGRI
jgi:DNA polymerase-3 subunit delta